MAGRFNQAFLDDLLSRIDIVELIDARVPLKRSGGSNYVACCPFHNEKTPSFNVSRPKQFYHCFGCGTSGDAIGFVMAFDRLAFPEAVARLAESVGIPLPADGRTASEDEEARLAQRLFEVQEKAARFYAHQLKVHPAAGAAVDYLKRRGISGEVARRYQLGYAPPAWNNLPSELPAEELRAAGLLISKGSSDYDRFRNRIMFPIRDRRGRIVGFGGRVLDDAVPKYLNSPETPVFKKGREVYGLHEALAASRQIERLIVVEGYMDVIALNQFGLPNAVATLGTATSPEQVALLFRHAEELVFCFDGDTAGRKAAWKALQAVLPVLTEGRTARFLALPQAQDPDSLIRREGADRFSERLAGAQLLSDYFFAELARELSLDTIEGRTMLIKRARPLLQTLKPGPFRQLMGVKLGELTNPPRFSRPAGNPVRPSPARSASVRPSALQRVLLLLVQNPRLATLIDDDVRDGISSDDAVGALLARVLALLVQQPEAAPDGLVERLRGTADEHEILRLLELDPLLPDDGVESEFRDALLHLVQQARIRRLDVLIQQAQSGTLDAAGRDEMRRLMAKPVPVH
jgi:DNA primase